jgi:hypothetical protein
MKLARVFWVYTCLALPPSSGFPLFRSKRLLKMQEEGQGPKRSLDLNQCVTRLNDWLAIYWIVMMSVVRLCFCSIMASWCRRLTA